MPKEIERKFLIDTRRITLPPSGTDIRQGYLPLSESVKTAARVRIKGGEGTLAIKGENLGAVRPEFEYGIPLEDAEAMLADLCQKPLIEKTRYELAFGEHLWEIDIFHGDNDGLVIAEVELSDVNEPFERPEWLLQEVTDDPRYYNSNLLQYPYRDWREA